jgi:hypothetical protein
MIKQERRIEMKTISLNPGFAQGSQKQKKGGDSKKE